MYILIRTTTGIPPCRSVISGMADVLVNDCPGVTGQLPFIQLQTFAIGAGMGNSKVSPRAVISALKVNVGVASSVKKKS